MSVPTDDVFAKLTKKMRFLTEQQLVDMRERQKEIENLGARLCLFEIAHSDLSLTQEQLDKVQLAGEYTEMLDEDKQIGALAVQKGIASQEEIAICIDTQKYEFASQRAIPRRLTEIMVEAEILTTEKSKALIEAFETAAAEEKAAGKYASTMKMPPVQVKAGSRPASSVRLRSSPAEGPDADSTIPYDKERIEAAAKAADVPPDMAADGDTPVEDSNPDLAGGAAKRPMSSPGRNFSTEGVTRRLTGRLVMETGEQTGRAIPLSGRGRIGRQMGCMVRIDDSRASREHSQIDYDDQLKHHVVSDLESRNGTYVNDVKITEATVLNPGDRIKIGDTVMRYEA